jgi:hypothetical protein
MSLILEAIEEHGVTDRAGGVLGVPCEGSKFHSPTPLVCTKVDLRDLVDNTEALSDVVWLCGVCAANLRIFVRLMVATEGDLEWEVRREFGNRIRDLGMKVWTYRKEVQHG